MSYRNETKDRAQPTLRWHTIVKESHALPIVLNKVMEMKLHASFIDGDDDSSYIQERENLKYKRASRMDVNIGDVQLGSPHVNIDRCPSMKKIAHRKITCSVQQIEVAGLGFASTYAYFDNNLDGNLVQK
jgi:hypothetical protein